MTSPIETTAHALVIIAEAGTFDDHGIVEATLYEAAQKLRKLEEAGWEQTNIILRAQTILGAYLPPDGIDKDEAISQLLGLLDGPDQRAAQDLWMKAVKA